MGAGIGSAVLASFRDGHVSRPAVGVVVISVLLAGMYWMTGRALGPVGRWWRGAPWIAFAGLIVAFPLAFLAYYVPSGGMEPTVLQGDSLLILRRFGRIPGRGDIIIHRYPLQRDQVFVKRVVAVGGDRVRIEDKKLIVNGTEVAEPYAVHNTPQKVPLRDDFPELPDFPLASPEWAKQMDASAGKDLTVPNGKLFVLGDNRDSSLDSRYWGFVDPADVLGTPLFIYWSIDKRSLQGEPDVPLAKVRWGRVLHSF
jgi:signal peptidase I